MIRRRFSICKSYSNKARQPMLLSGVGDSCPYCDQPMTRDSVSIDHIVPTAIGGTGDENNLRLCCKTCNVRKANLRMSQIKINHQGQIRGVVLACLRSGCGLRAAWIEVRKRKYGIGHAYFDEVVRRTCEEVGVAWFSDGWDEAAQKQYD